MNNLLNYDFKKEKSTKNLIENNNIYKKYQENQVIEGMIKNDPLFDLISQHKKRLQEIKEWQTNFANDITQSEITINDNDKINNLKKDLNNNNIEPDIKIEDDKIDNNIKLAKDFLKLNSLNKNQSSLDINNNNNNNNDDSSINININNTNYNNIINENNNNYTNINPNENNTNDNSYSVLKDSIKNDFDNNDNNILNIIEQKYMKTGTNFNKKLALDNIKNIENYKSNNTHTNVKKSKNYSSRINNYNTSNCSNNEIIKCLEFKLEKKRIKIKNLEASVDLLTKENENLKKYINELETKIENFNLNNKTNIISQDDLITREQEILNKINLLTKELSEKNEQIEEMKNSEKLKIQNIQLLTKKCQDLELLSNENNKEKITKIDKLINENNNFKSYMYNTDKIMFTINYFIKKIYNMIPFLANNECFQDVQEPYELQKHLIVIENFINEYIIYNSNKKYKFLIDFEKNRNDKYLIDINKEREREELEKKINEINEQNILLLKEIHNKKKIKKKKSANSSRGKKGINSRTNIKYKK